MGHHQRTQLGEVVAAQNPQLAVAVDDLQFHHVVGHATVAEGPRPAGVVPDHPADGAARRGGRVRAEPQTVGSGRPLEGFLHHPRVDHGGAGSFVDDVDAVQVLGDVYHEARSDRVARARGARAAHGDGEAALQGRPHERDQLVAVLGAGNHQGGYPVEGGVGGVDAAGEG